MKARTEGEPIDPDRMLYGAQGKPWVAIFSIWHLGDAERMFFVSLLTLLKQARAFGLGIVLATQNPVDLDYKGLSNAGTSFIGRLQTERDQTRVLDGLEGAQASAGARLDRRQMGQILAGLGNRVFLMNNVHGDRLALLESRWAMSYLRGPSLATRSVGWWNRSGLP